MLAVEAHAAAAAEGLALVRSENASGFKGVSRVNGGSTPQPARDTIELITFAADDATTAPQHAVSARNF